MKGGYSQSLTKEKTWSLYVLSFSPRDAPLSQFFVYENDIKNGKFSKTPRLRGQQQYRIRASREGIICKVKCVTGIELVEGVVRLEAQGFTW